MVFGIVGEVPQCQETIWRWVNTIRMGRWTSTCQLRWCHESSRMCMRVLNTRSRADPRLVFFLKDELYRSQPWYNLGEEWFRDWKFTGAGVSNLTKLPDPIWRRCIFIIGSSTALFSILQLHYCIAHCPKSGLQYPFSACLVECSHGISIGPPVRSISQLHSRAHQESMRKRKGKFDEFRAAWGNIGCENWL